MMRVKPIAKALAVFACVLFSGCGPDNRTDAQKAEDRRIIEETEKAKDFHDAVQDLQKQQQGNR